MSAVSDDDRVFVAGPADNMSCRMTTPASPGSNDDNAVGPTMSVESSPSRARNRVSDQLRFIQLNLQHCKAATATLWKHLAGSDKVVAMAQEPWINKDRILVKHYYIVDPMRLDREHVS